MTAMIASAVQGFKPVGSFRTTFPMFSVVVESQSFTALKFMEIAKFSSILSRGRKARIPLMAGSAFISRIFLI